ncbi:D-alanyl-D-alanine carboxypeptidase family protein [Thermodesulfobacteriota bacterium]
MVVIFGLSAAASAKTNVNRDHVVKKKHPKIRVMQRAKAKAPKTRVTSSTPHKKKISKRRSLKKRFRQRTASRKGLVRKRLSKTGKTANRKNKSKTKKARRGVQAKAVYCVNLRGNKTLMARNPDQQLPVASLTKLITALVAMDRMSLKHRVRVPSHIRKVPKSVVGLKAGDIVTVKDLLHGLLMRSGNDCAEALACAFPGGKKNFIRAMNKKVREMGAKKTVFYTPSGLDRKLYRKTKGKKKKLTVKSNVSTAREIARIARIAFSNPIIKGISKKKSYLMAGKKKKGGYRVRNTNRLLREHLPVVSGKTGYTARAGHCLASKFTPGRNIFLIVVLGSPDHFRDTRLLYRKALTQTKRLKQKNRRPHIRSKAQTRFSGRG